MVFISGRENDSGDLKAYWPEHDISVTHLGPEGSRSLSLGV